MRRREFLLGATAAPLLRPAEQPTAEANVRGMMRLFVSETEDKPWFYDREMWPAYCAMLAENGFNRFQLAFGIGYDFLREVTDAYFLLAYPFFLDVPAYKVRAVGLADAERARNLEMLRYISDQVAAHGLRFQLGIWMHGYEWANSPRANYTIAGLNSENHGEYCREALRMLLAACPAISGVTFRIHGESGVTEGSYDFWKTVFDGAVRSSRKVGLDLHAKGIDQHMIDTALGTGLPVTISPKFWAEHMGMPYLQASIREQEMPHGERTGLMALSSGTRSFTRYSYADLLREDRRYGVVHRIWPGTQRLLIWGDPLFASAYARTFSLYGANGVEVMEPLSFKGRRGSGLAGGRCAYADATLAPRWDWQKYRRTYQVWGAAVSHPEAPQPAAGLDKALASASRILPIVTTVHSPSAANNTYWPEIYTPQPMVDASHNNPYTDTPSPRTFGNAGSFDPQLFAGVNEFAAELLENKRSGKYSPIEVAQWLEDLAQEAEFAMSQAGTPSNFEARRTAIDIRIQAALGRFFAARFRTGVLYAIHEKTGDGAALERALETYRSACDLWARMAESARRVYAADITVGEHPWLRGHWTDRLPALEDDLAAMAKRASPVQAGSAAADPHVQRAIAAALGHEQRAPIVCRHTPEARLPKQAALAIEIETPANAATRLWYRHLNQAERWQVVEMRATGGGRRASASIPLAYTGSPFPVQYYFEVRLAPEKVWLYPGFDRTLANQPYFVVRPA